MKGGAGYDSHRSASFPLASFPLGVNHTGDWLSAWLIQPRIPDADRRAAGPRYPAGPGLSAVDMAAACLCLADVVWNADATQASGRRSTCAVPEGDKSWRDDIIGTGPRWS